MKKIFLVILCLILCSCGIIDRSAKVDNVFKDYPYYQYYYDNLNDEDKEIYEDLYNNIMAYNFSFTTMDKSLDKIDEIMQKVLFDHPEIFWIDYISYNSFTNHLKLSTNCDKDEVKDIQNKLDIKINEILSNIDPNASDYDKCKYIYEYVCNNSEYLLDSANNQNIQSVLLNKVSVCAGYAKTVQILLNRLNIKCTYIAGKLTHNEEDANHAWNMVVLDDDYYYMDATWGDMVKGYPHVCDLFLMMDNEEADYFYHADIDLEKTKGNKYTNYELVVQNSFDYNYLDQQIKNNLLTNRRVIELKINPQVYSSYKARLADGSTIYSILENNGIYVDKVSYGEYEELGFIEIYY